MRILVRIGLISAWWTVVLSLSKICYDEHLELPNKDDIYFGIIGSVILLIASALINGHIIYMTKKDIWNE